MANKELYSLEGREVMILRGYKGEPATMRITLSMDPHEFIDADIVYDDLHVKLLDPDVVLRQTKDGEYYVDYSDQTLGR